MTRDDGDRDLRLKMVAEVYLEAKECGDDPDAAIADTWGCTLRRAGKWTTDARRVGYLPVTALEALAIEVGQLLRRHRLQLDKTQSEVASSVGVTQGSYSAYERGKAFPKAETFILLVRELGLPDAEVQRLLPGAETRVDRNRKAEEA